MPWTTERVQAHLQTTPDVADRVIGLVRGTIDPFSLPGMQRWYQQCYHKPEPRRPDTIMRAIAEVVDGYSVEAIAGDHVPSDRYWSDTCALYIGQEDTYDPTVLYDRVRNKYVLTSTGDWVERYQRKYRIR